MVSSRFCTERASLIYVIGRVNQGLRREMQARLSDRGLSVQQYAALAVLRARPGLSNAQLARHSLVAPQSMIEILSKLERRGLVTREVDPDNGRILRAAVTPAALDALRRLDPEIDAIQDQLLAGVPSAHRAVLLETMLSAMDRLSSGLFS